MEYSSIFVCLMGMGTVFFGLICLIALTYLMSAVVGRGKKAAPAPVPAAPQTAGEVTPELVAAVSAAAPAPAASAAPAAGEQICAPMPGNILAVNVTAGQAVKKGRRADGSGGHEDGERDHVPPGRRGGLRQYLQGRFRGVRHAAVRPPVRQGRYGRDHSLFTGHRLLPLFPGRQLALPHHAGHRLRAAVSGHCKEV